jgi:hypothetical protein
MKHIKPSENLEQWPRKVQPTVEARKRDLIVRIADWTRQSLRTGEPAYDVEVYIGGVYDWNESKTMTLREYKTKGAAKAAAVKFVQDQVAKLL